MKQKGFTLVELLVVVAIIAILSVIGLTIFTTAQQNARDARRRIDIDAISKALETNKGVATVVYSPLATTQFSGGSIPQDSTTAQYSIKTDTANTVPPDPITWAATDPNPTNPASWVTVSSSVSFTNVNAWKVCARLETGAFYCKPSSQ